MAKINLYTGKTPVGTFQEFLGSVLSGDGKIHISYGNNFFISLAVEIGDLLDEAFDKAMKNIGEEYNISPLWIYDYRFNPIDGDPLPIEKLSTPSLNSELENFVSDIDYILSRWNLITTLDSEALLNTQRWIRNKLIICSKNHLNEFQKLIDKLFKYVEDHIHSFTDKKVAELKWIHCKEVQRTKHLNKVSLLLKKLILNVFKIESRIKNKSVTNLLISDIISSINLYEKTNTLVSQSLGIAELYKTGFLSQDLDYYLGTELGFDISGITEEYQENRKEFVQTAAQLNIDYTIAQVASFYHRANIDIPKLTEISPKIFFDIKEPTPREEEPNTSEEESSAIKINTKELRKKLSLRSNVNYSKELTEELVFKWIKGKEYYRGMKEELIEYLRKEHKKNHEEGDEPSYDIIKGRLDSYRGNLSFKEWLNEK